MKGLCHICLKSNIEIIIKHGNMICKDCIKENAKN